MKSPREEQLILERSVSSLTISMATDENKIEYSLN